MSDRYILWDHDGVLVDTERWYFEATRRALASLEHELTREAYMKSLRDGTSCWQPLRDQGGSEEELTRHKSMRNEWYREFLRTEAIEIEGVREVLAELGSCFRMAIVTTARRADFDLIHERGDLLRFFEFALTVGDYPRAKPHPDPYLAALERFRAQPDEAVVVEDSRRGLESARRAGIDCVIIRTPFMADQDFPGAAAVVDSIRDLPGVLADRHR